MRLCVPRGGTVSHPRTFFNSLEFSEKNATKFTPGAMALGTTEKDFREFCRLHPLEGVAWRAVMTQNFEALRRALEVPLLDVNLRHPLLMSGAPMIYMVVHFYMKETGISDETWGRDNFKCDKRKSGGKAGKAYKALELFLRHGVDVNASCRFPDGKIMLPLGLLCQGGFADAVQLFMDLSPTLDVMAKIDYERVGRKCIAWPLVQAICTREDDVALMLIRHPSFVAGRDSRVLFHAVEVDSRRIVTELLGLAGTARVINLPNPTMLLTFGTPLTKACYCGHSCVPLLLEAGADLLLTCEGKPPPAHLVEPDIPSLRLTPMANAIAAGAEPRVIDFLVAAGAHRPTIEVPVGTLFQYLSDAMAFGMT